MKQPSAYLKMRILGAIDIAEGKTREERIKNVARLTFTDDDGERRIFTWRTIQTWLYRYKNHGITGIENSLRSDKGKPRKITHE
ncbi:MAG: helix-turn-helix domain-containing protein [Deltaproteobacteria bacterium]|nr:helix-turn-helix domain-containing protein [Deltaproteobacteria bacterium]